jgi:hypothetical protein
VFFAPEKAGAASLDDAETFRMPGYFKPFHYGSALEYLTTGAYHEEGFQRFTRDRFERHVVEGKDPTLWD